MTKESEFTEYARLAIEEYRGYEEAQRNMMVNAIEGRDARAVLDVGCGAGHYLLPFAAKQGALCVGIDVGEEVGVVGQSVFQQSNAEGLGVFLRAKGEELPFPDESFDVVICRVALPYMDNRKTIAEISRVLRPGGMFFLKIHAPAFYIRMLRKRLPMWSLKQLAYPVICLMCGTINMATGKHPRSRFWHGKEVYQTQRSLEKELSKNDLRIVRQLSDTNRATPSYLIEKVCFDFQCPDR